MGLSYGERFDGAIHCVNEMYKLRGFKNISRLKGVNELLTQLWPALLANSSNKSLWLFGGEMQSDHFKEVSFLGSAFKNAILREKKEPPFADVFEGYYPDILHFLKQPSEAHDANYVNVCKLFMLAESYFYYANRYRDAFSKRFRATNDIVARVQGVLWDELSNNPIFVNAWMCSEIIQRAIFKFKEDDIVTQWALKDHLHHYISMRELDDAFILTTFKELQAKPHEKLSAQKRVELIFKFIGRHFHYDHQHNDLLKLIEVWNKKNRKDKIDKKIVHKLCQDAQVAYRKNEKQSRSSWGTYCYLTEQSIEK